MKAKDLTGRVVGRLTVLEFSGTSRTKSRTHRLWKCKCICGNVVTVSTSNLSSREGAVKSCGCLQADAVRAAVQKHGMTGTPEYKIWAGMWKRCTNENCRAYKYYGARGIFVCERWSNFENFFADMGRRPSERHSIDRIDNKGPYDLANCRWTLGRMQANNKSDTRIVEFNGKALALSEWCRQMEISYKMVHSRLAQGWTLEEAALIPDTSDRTSLLAAIKGTSTFIGNLKRNGQLV